jgi:hypothetical protein
MHLPGKFNKSTIFDCNRDKKSTIREDIKMTKKTQRKSFSPIGHLRLLAIYLVPVIALVAGASLPACWAQENGDEIQFADANVFLELNNTDGDLGFHAAIDGDAWKSLSIENPRDKKSLNIRTGGSLQIHGLTQLDFESAEPPFEELDPGVFFQRFPEGEYDIEGRTIDGQEMESTATLTHVLPGPPRNIAVNGIALSDGCDESAGPVVDGPLVITWDEVTESHPELGRTGEPIEIVYYQVVLDQLDLGLTFTTELPPETTEIVIPENFSDYGGAFKLEILVKEESGNKTATETCFTVE